MTQQVEDKPSIEEAIEHFGTKGMKWGVRKGKSETGVSRFSGALIDRNARGAKVLNDAKAGTKYKMSVKLGKKILSEDQWNQNVKTSLKNMKLQDKRLKAGKQTLEDRLDKYASVSLFDLAVTRTPR